MATEYHKAASAAFIFSGVNGAKGEGFDVKILKEVIRLRKQDQEERDERESLLDIYMHALGSGSAPLMEAAE